MAADRPEPAFPLRLSSPCPAKINLCLHVTGRRADGYHLLDSLVAFAACGDLLHVEAADALDLTVEGRFGAGLQSVGAGNLVLRAAETLRQSLGADPGCGRYGARLHLEKNLPLASGIGGGSADAAAALRLLSRLWMVRGDVTSIALALGADVPVCLASQSARMRGIGEIVEPVALPPCGLLLVNPGLAVPTGPVFARLAAGPQGVSAPLNIPQFRSAHELADWLGTTRNDLQAPATELCAEIGAVLAAIAAVPGCLLARMSGSGATCFGLFANVAAAEAAVMPPHWWSSAGGLFQSDWQ